MAGECEWTVPAGTASGRADKLLARCLPERSRTRWQKLFAEGRIWTEERVLCQRDRLRAGDVVWYSLPDPVPLQLRPVAMDLRVAYEDDDLLVVDKAAGVVVHPGAGTGEDTLVHGLLSHCGDSLRGIGGTERPGIVHRLDRETSGLLVVAKTEAAFRGLAEQFMERSVRKEYRALVAGIPEPSEGLIEEAIGRHPTQRTRMCCRPDGRAAKSDYRVEQRWGTRAARVAVRIHTGRTHQIRVHMKAIGHPLLGDPLYGGRGVGAATAPRVMLHAARLGFRHPVRGKDLDLRSEPPEDFLEVEARLAGGESR